MTPNLLEQLYQEARTALKAKNFDRASDLLRQILLVDENYKDASRLLAQTVKLRRRRWYNHPLLWATMGLAVLVVIGAFLAPLIRGYYASQVILPTDSPTPTAPPTATLRPTQTPTPTPTTIPLAWKRIYIGQEFLRDRITAIAADPNDPDVIYVGTASAGVYKTINGGESWVPAFHGINYPKITELLINSQHPNILYASTDHGVYRTLDGGQTWQINKMQPFQIITMDPQDNSHLYFFATGGDSLLYESFDGGETLIRNYSSSESGCPIGRYTLAIHPTISDRIYIVEDKWNPTCQPGVYMSNDAGRSWTLLGLESTQNLSRVTIGMDQNGDEIIYAELEDRTLHISHDGGESWVELQFQCSKVTIDGSLPWHAYCNGSGKLMVTEDGGFSWKSIFVPGDISAISMDHAQGRNRIMIGGNSLLISSDGGASWTEYTNGLGGSQMTIKVNPANPMNIYMVLYPERRPVVCMLYHSVDQGKSWTYLFDIRDCVPSFDNDGNFFAIKDELFMMLPVGGFIWSEIGQPDVPIQYALVNPGIPGLFYWMWMNDKTLTVLLSTDFSESWQESTGSPFEVLICGVDPRLFFSKDGNIVYLNNCITTFYSVNAGRDWKYGRTESSVGINERLAVDPLDGTRFLLAGGSGGIYSYRIKEDGSFETIGDGDKDGLRLMDVFVNTIAIDPNNPDTIYAGTDSGAYISFDGGEDWNQINEGLLGALVVYSIVVDKDSNVYAATPYGIFKLEGK
jgi:photosystem II stability/assembly factor-like uncharacterized protein